MYPKKSLPAAVHVAGASFEIFAWRAGQIRKARRQRQRRRSDRL